MMIIINLITGLDIVIDEPQVYFLNHKLTMEHFFKTYQGLKGYVDGWCKPLPTN